MLRLLTTILLLSVLLVSPALAQEGVPTECDDFANPTEAAKEGFTCSPAETLAAATPSAAPAASQYQYGAGAAVLPETGGTSLLSLGAGVLLVMGGLLARRVVQ